MTTLHDRLADLAEDASTPTTGDDLWDRGRRYARRRRAGTAVIATVAAVVLAAVVGTAWVRTPHDVPPAAPGGQLRLPDHLYEPSPWLPGTDHTGPVGPVVALVRASRGSDGVGVAAVSTSGAYTFLDLPDWADREEGPVVVSPDGRWVAYWLTGDTSGEVNTNSGPDPVVGIGVYDTVSGDAERYVVPTEHGLQVDDVAWGGSTLWFDYLQYASGGSKDGHAEMPLDETSGLAWDLGDGRQRTFTGREMPTTYSSTSDNGSLVTVGGRQLVTSTIDQPRSVRGRFDTRVESTAYFDPTGERVAIQADTDPPDVASDKTEPVLVAATGSGDLTTTRVPGKRVNVVLGWRDEQHVVVQRYGKSDGAYLSMDLETGATEPLLTLPVGSGLGALVPQDVWGAPQFDAPPPPDPMSPRSKTMLSAAGIATVLVAVGGLVLWRRRVRA